MAGVANVGALCCVLSAAIVNAFVRWMCVCKGDPAVQVFQIEFSVLRGPAFAGNEEF